MRIKMQKLLERVKRYDKEADLDIIWEVWSTICEEHRQFIMDALSVLDNNQDHEAGVVAAAYQNMSQYGKMTREFRKQNEFTQVLQDDSKVLALDRDGNLVVS